MKDQNIRRDKNRNGNVNEMDNFVGGLNLIQKLLSEYVPIYGVTESFKKIRNKFPSEKVGKEFQEILMQMFRICDDTSISLEVSKVRVDKRY